ncbi:MAG TPA: S9 family peptidase [Pyrinomonadaceae bacterium]|nr:S9 family peptidase [Pyrinomonadaceae bacterium]
MKNLKLTLPVLFAIFLLSIAALAQQPPLIDREIFFGNPEYAGAQISPDGKFISFIKPLKDVRNVWVKGVDEPFEKARPLTAERKRPVSGYFWSWDSKYILFTKDNDGDENFNVFAVDPAASPAAGSDVPAATNLTNAKGVRTFIYNVPDTEPDFIYIGINDRDKAWHDLYKVQISTGTKTLMRENKDRLTGWVFDNSGKVRMATRSAPDGTTEVLRVDGDKFTSVYSCGVFENCGPVNFAKDNKRVYMVSNKGNRDLIQLVLFDPETGKEELVEQDPMGRVDFGNASFSNVTKELISTSYNDDRVRIYFKDKKFEKDYDLIKKRLGDREIAFGSSTKDETKFVVSTFSDVDPGTVWIFDRKTKNLSTLYQVREKIDRKALSPMTPVRYKSSDGLEIPAYLTLPKGTAGKNLPVIVVPHGGPWGRDSWGYNSMAQFLANRGYAVLQPNFRASTGYGKKFLDSGNNQWGEKMQDDITWGVKYLIDQGIADPKRVGIMGGSYGGYATLAGVTFTPDLYAAAVAIVAPSNLNTLLGAIPPYWESVRVQFAKRMGDYNTPEGRAQLERQSPLNHVAKIKTPLMVVQGANDPRVNKREADQIVIALRERGYPVQYLLADDEGHGFQRPVNNMAMFAAGEKFLAQYLGGRYQETMTPEVAKRLAEITVDPKTVVMVQKASASGAVGTGLNGKWSWVVEAPGQQLELAVELKEVGGSFSGTSTSMIGNAVIEGGKVNGKKFTAKLKADIQGQPTEFTIEGVMDGNTLAGTITGAGFGSLPFTATRAK